jgi:hypothetical protein
MNYYAWYSKQYESRYGHCIYARNNGEKIKVSIVSQDKNSERILWPDLEYVGEVERMIESHTKPLPTVNSNDKQNKINMLIKNSLEHLGHSIASCACESCKRVRLCLKGLDKKNPFGLN